MKGSLFLDEGSQDEGLGVLSIPAYRKVGVLSRVHDRIREKLRTSTESFRTRSGVLLTGKLTELEEFFSNLKSEEEMMERTLFEEKIQQDTSEKMIRRAGEVSQELSSARGFRELVARSLEKTKGKILELVVESLRDSKIEECVSKLGKLIDASTSEMMEEAKKVMKEKLSSLEKTRKETKESSERMESKRETLVQKMYEDQVELLESKRRLAQGKMPRAGDAPGKLLLEEIESKATKIKENSESVNDVLGFLRKNKRSCFFELPRILEAMYGKDPWDTLANSQNLSRKNAQFVLNAMSYSLEEKNRRKMILRH